MPRQRRKLSLLQWGLICIISGVISQLLMPLIQGPPKNRAELAGRSFAILVILVIGLALCFTHFIRAKSRRTRPTITRKESAKRANPPRV
jgi:peptidoglycan/LPS O-acetylase OafA/YrhL